MYLVSACLAGCPCRYDGKDNRNNEIVALVNAGKAIPVCPEQLGELTTPRIPAEITKSLGNTLQVVNQEGIDVTDAFTLGAKRTLKIAKALDIKKAVLKAKSPSCGKDLIYDGTFSKKLVQGHGLAAAYLIENGIEVISEKELSNLSNQ
ncbi:MAG: DUF523 domain-containing protein [Cellulosilyticaceae bacterium]